MNIEDLEILKELSEQTYFGDLPFLYYADLIGKLLTAYEKEKGENVKLRLQDIPLMEGEVKAYKDRVNELKIELEKEKEKNKKIENELEKHIKFCEQEAKSSLNNEICHIALKFNKGLLDIINEEE